MKYSSLALLAAISGTILTVASSALADPPTPQPLLPVDQIPVPPARSDTLASITSPATQPSQATGKVAILPFAPLGDADQRQWVAQAVQQTLATEIARLGGLSPVLAPASTGAPVDSAAARDAAKALGADVVVLGAYQIVGSDVRFTGQIVQVNGGQSVGGLKVSGDFRDLFELEDELAAQVHRVLRPPMPADSAPANSTPIFAGAVPAVNATDFFAPPTDASRFADQYNHYYNAQPSYSPYIFSGWGYGSSLGYSYGSFYPNFGNGWGNSTIIVQNGSPSPRHHPGGDGNATSNPPVVMPPQQPLPTTPPIGRPVQNMPYGWQSH